MKKTAFIIIAVFIAICGALPTAAASVGDVDGNGNVNATDAVILSRYIATWSGYAPQIKTENCVLDSDSEITATDSVILSRYLAGWSGYKTLPFDKTFREYTELGIPSSAKYSTGIRSRCVQDIAYWNGKLYVGSGDASANVGPIDIYAYDTASKSWNVSGSVADEEISRFRVIDGSLIATGVDPQETWTLGNFYRLNDQTGSWDKVRTIPNAIHTFDMLEYDGMIFAGIAVQPGYGYPIAVSKDNGASFAQVEMYKNGVLRDISERQIIRVYELFLYNDTVYALFRYQNTTSATVELYRYENGKFVYDNSWGSKIDAPSHIKYMVGGRTVFKDKLYFTISYLYSTDDMSEIKCYEDFDCTVCDLCVVDDKLYVLTYVKNDDGSYTMTIFENADGSDTGFTKYIHFDYSAPALSFDYGDGKFYIGIGDINNTIDENGMVLAVDYVV